MATTVFLVDGYGFKGYLVNISIVNDYRTKGATVTQFDYNNFDATTGNITNAAQHLKTLALAAGGTVVFVGVSMGSQVLCNLLRSESVSNTKHGLPFTLPFSLGAETSSLVDWRFILLANPEHVSTGRRTTAQYGGLGIPSTTPHPVTDIAAQYDFWADCPNKANQSFASWANIYSWLYGNVVHMTGYNLLDPTLPYPFVVRGSNIRDMWVPNQTVFPWNQTLIEQGYSRPVRLQ